MSLLGRCPEPWYGPDDYEEGDDIDGAIATRDREIAEWRQAYARLSWRQWLRRCFAPL